MLSKFNYTSNFITIITILLTFFICSCSNKLLYIENDNHFKFYDFYKNNISSRSGNLKLVATFNDSESLNIVKKRFDIIKSSYLYKFDILVIILYSDDNKNNSLLFDNIYTYLTNFYLYLKNIKLFTNNFYTLGIPQNNIDNYDVLIFLIKRNSTKHLLYQ